MYDLNGKVCVVTGAGSGIGRRIAERYALAGGKVVVADLNEEGAQETVRHLNVDDAMAVRMDVTDEDSVNGAVGRVIERFGRIDVLVSNAGIQIVHAIQDFSFAEWKKLLSVHLDGAFLTSKAVIPHMYEQGGGSIVFMGSVHSKEASPLKSAYVTAKHGLLGLAREIATEGGEHGVRANVICPGFVKTPLVEKQIPEQARDLGISEKQVVEEVMLGGTVDKEFTRPGDVAEVALMFATFPSNALTGQSLVVSHGWYMN